MRIITNLISWLKRHIRDQLGFTHAETNGMLVLLLLISCFLAVPPLIRWYDRKYRSPNYDIDIALLNNTLAWLQQQSAGMKSRDDEQQDARDVFPQTPAPSSTKTPHQPSAHSSFDINTATAQKLQTLPGIGPTRSARIIKYRDKLGGFVRQDQYAEVYGLDTLALNSLLQYAYIKPSFQPKKLDINHATFKTLIVHPYLTYQQVQQIVRRREKKGKFRQIEELVQVGILEQATFERVKDYLET